MFERAKQFYNEHEPACTAGFFAAGFLFDVLAVGRIDELRNMLQQALYLLLCAFFTGLELREGRGKFTPPQHLRTVWRYHVGATHFMLGTLLNIYTLFYFKSASFGTSLLFLLFLISLLAVNELKPFKNSGTLLRMALFSLCLLSYFTYLVPTLLGHIGVMPFLGSIVGAGGCAAALVWWLYSRMPGERPAVRRNVVYPFASVAALFCALYFAKVIPPVPLSLSEIGVYHGVRREGDRFALSSLRPRWKFWQRGDQDFFSRPGDTIYCWVAVFSPTHFTDRLSVRWQFHEKDGWGAPDDIPLEIAGGREGGWRGFTVKANYKPGPWRVEIVTSDSRELGRIGLTVIPDDSTGPRTMRTIWR
jgi:hypothetical protein